MIYSIWAAPAIAFFYFVCSLFLPIKHRKNLLVFFNFFLLLIINGIALSLLLLAIFVLNFLPNVFSTFNKRAVTFGLIFLNGSFLLLFKLLPIAMKNPILAPLGLSLFILQQIAFIVDRERNADLSEISLKDFFLYSFLFTHFFTGPVAKISQLLKEQPAHLLLKKVAISQGIFLIFCGLFQKLIIADNIAVLTSSMFNQELKVKDFDITLSFLLNKYEIFANFNGFSDIALGSALILGIELPANFNRPFHTSSLAEFWKRWHMSLVSWIREYVFFPFILSPLGKLGVSCALLLTFTIFGLWHEIKWTFFLYDVIQVFVILIEKKGRRLSVHPFLRWIFFYVVLISIPGILFRSKNVSQFISILTSLKQSSLPGILKIIITYKGVLIPALIGIILYESVFSRKSVSIIQFFHNRHFISRIILFSAMALLLLLMKSSSTGNGFIYATF